MGISAPQRCRQARRRHISLARVARATKVDVRAAPVGENDSMRTDHIAFAAAPESPTSSVDTGEASTAGASIGRAAKIGRHDGRRHRRRAGGSCWDRIPRPDPPSGSP